MKKQLVAMFAVILSVSMVFGACTGTPAGEGSKSSTEESTTSSTESLGESTGEASESTSEAPVVEGEEVLAENQSIIVGTEAHEGTYNYMYSSSAYDRQVCNLVYQALVISNETGITRANDLIVEKLDVSEDGKTYTFTLKEGIKFSDGTDLKASDVVFTYKALADPSCTAYFLSNIYALEGAEAYYKGETSDFTAVEATDDKTVVFHFSDNLRTNIGSADIGILSEAYYPDWEAGKSNEVMSAKMSQPMGSGPYTLKEYAPSQYTILEYNDNFWADAETDYKIKTVTVKFTNGDTEMDEIITKSVDVLPQIIDKEYVDRVVNDEDGVGAPSYINLLQYKRSAYGYIGFNTQEGQTANPAIRQAIAYAFDRAAFVEAQYGDLARTLAVPMSQASSIFDAVEGGLNDYAFSYDSARTVLEEAGYTWDDAGKLVDPDGKVVVLKFLATTGNPVINAMVPVLSDNLTEIGIELDIQSIEFASMLPLVQDANSLDWNMFFMASGWSSDEPDTWYNLFHKNGIPQTNSTRYDNPVVSQLLDDGRKELDLTAPSAIELYSKIAMELNRDIPQLPIYANTLTAFINSKVKNLNIDTFQEWNFALEGAYIVEETA